MTNECLNELFECIKSDDVTSVMRIVIQKGWFNIRFPKSINNHFSKDYPILSNQAPIIGIAAYFGSYDVFRFLAANNSDVKLSDDNNMNSIGFAIAGNKVDILECLFDMNAVDTSTANEYFLYACKFNSLDILKLYIDKLEFDVNAYDSKGYQCIHYATINGNIEMIKILLDHGADINGATRVDQRTPLMFASVINKPEVVKFILSIDCVDPSLTTKFDDTALILASAPGFVENVKLLIETGKVDINSQNSNKATALHNAVINNKIDLIKYLIQQPEIDLQIQDSGGFTPLFRAMFLQHIEVMKILRDHAKNIEDSIICGKQSLIHLATTMDSPDLLNLLINDWKLDVNVDNSPCEETPIAIAIKKGYINALSFLLKVPGRKLGNVKPISTYRREKFPEIKEDVLSVLENNNGKDIIQEYNKQKTIFNEQNPQTNQ